MKKLINKKSFVKNPLVMSLSICALSMASMPALSANDAVLKRMEILEKELKELKETLAKKEEVQLKKGVELKKGVRFQYGGYVKFDATSTDTSELPFYFNSNSIDADSSQSKERTFDTTAKQSRFWLKTNSETAMGDLMSYIEMDFSSGGGTESITNSDSNNIRHALLKWSYAPGSSLLAGQTWTTFMNTGALPETLDWVGPTSGTIFIRQPQIRWTKGLSNGNSIMLSLENPESFIGTDLDDTESSPDIIARYNGKAGGFSYSISALVRQVSQTDTSSPFDDGSESLSAFNLAGKYAFENGNDIKFSYTTGSPGRYLAVGAVKDAYVDGSGNLKAYDADGWYLAYKHKWTSKLRTNIVYAETDIDNAQAGETETVSNANINLIYSPVPKLSLGAEYITGEKEWQGGQDGDAKRLQVTAKYAW